MLIMGIVEASLSYAYYKLKAKKSNGTKIPKILYYNPPKKSM